MNSLRPRHYSSRNMLVCLMFHNPMPAKRPVDSLSGLPGEGITFEDIETCIKYFQGVGGRFISSVDLEKANELKGLSILLTFDDGYRNCLDILPLLEKYRAPATFFIITNPVKNGELFFWDAVYDYERKFGHDHRAASRAVEYVKNLNPEKRREFLRSRYGEGILHIKSDISRPLTSGELKIIAQHPMATIGCHTLDHVPLDLCDDLSLQRQVLEANRYLEEICGRPVTSFAYPYGRYNPTVLDYVKNLGFEFGFGCDEGINALPLESPYALRRSNPVGWWNMGIQCRYFLSGRLTTRSLKNFLGIYAYARTGKR